jgi:hypothetical protein
MELTSFSPEPTGIAQKQNFANCTISGRSPSIRARFTEADEYLKHFEERERLDFGLCLGKGNMSAPISTRKRERPSFTTGHAGGKVAVFAHAALNLAPQIALAFGSFILRTSMRKATHFVQRMLWKRHSGRGHLGS